MSEAVEEAGLKEMLNALIVESDRSSAILGAAYLDIKLENILITAFKTELEPEEKGLLFGENGPLLSLAVKSRLGHAIGLYGSVTRNDILLVSKIRNAFAHSPQHVSFSNELIKENCRHLRAVKAYCNANLISIGSDEFSEFGPKHIFISTITIIPAMIYTSMTERLSRKQAVSQAKIDFFNYLTNGNHLEANKYFLDTIFKEPPKLP